MFKSRQEITRLVTIIIETLYEVCPNGTVAESMVYLALGMDLSKSNALLTLCEQSGWIKRKGNRIGLTAAGRKLMEDAQSEVARKAQS